MSGLKTPIIQLSNRTILIDQPDVNTTYLGIAIFGAATSATIWQIKKIFVNGSLTSIQWANGSDSENNVWDNRTSYTYS